MSCDSFFNETLPRCITISFIFYFAWLIFIQNFIASESFNLNNFRNYDDMAFQIELRYIHTTQNMVDLLNKNACGYGWIYWIFIAIATYPAFLLQQSSGIDWLLLVTPRMVSLLFAIFSTIVFYKIISIYAKNEWITLTAIVFYPFTVTLSYFSGYFGTQTIATFFSTLAIYLVAKEDKITVVNLSYGMFSLAVACGIKLTSFIVVPMFVLLVFGKYHYHFSRKNVLTWLKLSVCPTFLFVFLASPPLALFFIMPERAKMALNSFMWAIGHAKSNALPILELLYDGQVSAFFPWYIFTVLCSFLIWYTWYLYSRKDRNFFDFFAYLIGYVLSILMVSLAVSHYSHLFAIYTTATIFCLPLSIVFMEKFLKKIYILVLVLSLVCVQSHYLYIINKNGLFKSFAANGLEKSYGTPLGYFSGFMFLERERKLSSKLLYLTSSLDEFKNNEQISILADEEIPIYMSQLKYNNIKFNVVFNNLPLSKNVDFNVLVLSKKRLNLLHPEERLYKLKHAGVFYIENNKLDKLIQDNFFKTNMLFGKKFILIHEDNEFLMYKRVNTNDE